MRLWASSVIVALGVAACVAGPARAWDAGGNPLKAEIDKFLGELRTNTNGVISWDGSDPYEVSQDDGASVALITHARLSLHAAKDVAQLAFDRIEVRRRVDPGDDKLVDYAFALPAEAMLTVSDGTQIKLTLDDAKASLVTEANTEHARGSALSLASARIDVPNSGAWVAFGPLSASSKLTPDANGGYSATGDFEWKKIEFLIPGGPAGGTIDRLAYTATYAGPSLADLYKFQAEAQAAKPQTDPAQRQAALLSLLADAMTAYSEGSGQLEAEGITVRGPNGNVASLAKASLSSELSGLSDDNAALRITMKHDGLDLAPSVLPADKVPHRMVIDFGLEKVSTAALRAVIVAAAKMIGSDDDKQAATTDMMAAAIRLNPTFRIYDIAGDTKDVGIDITGTATGSPLLPGGYTANADAVVRGFDSLPALAAGVPMIDYLPLLKELGSPGDPTDSPPRLKFHLTSVPQKWLMINGNDVSAWFIGEKPAPGQPRLLKPAVPAMSGADVSAVQNALAAANFVVPPSGAYDAPTTVAVARFQKQNGLNASGVVDAATWRKLGVKAEAASPPQQK